MVANVCLMVVVFSSAASRKRERESLIKKITRPTRRSLWPPRSQAAAGTIATAAVELTVVGAVGGGEERPSTQSFENPLFKHARAEGGGAGLDP